MDAAAAADVGAGRKRRTLGLPVLLFVLSLAVFGAAFYFADGMTLVEGLFSERVPEPVKPKSPAGAPAASTEPSDTPPAEEGASLQPEGLPTGVDVAFADSVFHEQAESRSTITKLVSGRVAKISVVSVRQSGQTAEIAVDVEFTDGTSASGTLGLVSAGGAWYLASMTGESGVERDGSDLDIDTALRDIVMREQAANQTYFAGLVDGTYTSMTVGKPGPGARTLSFPVTFAGPSVSGEAGRLVAVSKDVGARRYWFITSFRK